MSQELIEQHIQEAETFSIQSPADLENFRLKYLSKKGVLADMFALMKNIEIVFRYFDELMEQKINPRKKIGFKLPRKKK